MREQQQQFLVKRAQSALQRRRWRPGPASTPVKLAISVYLHIAAEVWVKVAFICLQVLASAALSGMLAPACPRRFHLLLECAGKLAVRPHALDARVHLRNVRVALCRQIRLADRRGGRIRVRRFHRIQIFVRRFFRAAPCSRKAQARQRLPLSEQTYLGAANPSWSFPRVVLWLQEVGFQIDSRVVRPGNSIRPSSLARHPAPPAWPRAYPHIV